MVQFAKPHYLYSTKMLPVEDASQQSILRTFSGEQALLRLMARNTFLLATY
jgi:hypothetical protein